MQANQSAGENVSPPTYDVDDIDEDMPFELLEHAKEAVLELLPEQSRQKYNRVYKNFKDWQSSHGSPNITNQLILAYFHMLATKKNYKPTSLWAYHSMLKATLRTFEDTDIGKFLQVTAFLKSKSAGYRSKKARVFTEENLKTFIDNADNLSWLDVKVICIFGICGALRTDEFTRINMEDVEKHGDLFLVKIHKTKTRIPRSFTINGEFAVIVQKFIDLRPSDLKSNDRFFTNFQRGKCTKQFIGKNKFSNMPRRIAEHLKLAEPKRYTGHSFRRTSATILANSGADIETIMRHGGWRNETCAKAYIEDSLGYKAKTGAMIHQSILGGVAASAIAGISVPGTSAGISVPGTSPGISVPVTSVSTSAGISVPDTSAGISVPGTSAGTLEYDEFDSGITDEEFVEIVDHASQSYQQPNQFDIPPTNATAHSPIHGESFFDSGISDEQFIDIVDHASQTCQQSTEVLMGSDIGRLGRRETPRVNIDKNESASPTVLTQSTNNSLNAILARSFKSVNFEKMENCHFNFYFPK